jgi:hypothetical protein
MSHLHASAPAASAGRSADDSSLEATARRRAGARMGWYVHAMVYLAVNTVLMLVSFSTGAAGPSSLRWAGAWACCCTASVSGCRWAAAACSSG